MPNEKLSEKNNCSIPGELKRELYLREAELVVLPGVALEAIQMTKNPDCSMAGFACLIEKDVKLASDVLSLANSSMFSSENRVNCLHNAIVRLGIQQVRNLIISACAKRLMVNLDLEQEWIREALWKHSFMTGAACVHINRLFGLGFQGEEFAAGLLHDFGRTLFAVIRPDEFMKADPLDFTEEEGFLNQERGILGVDHCEFGSWFAERNRLPEDLVDAIRWHHAPEKALGSKELVALVAAADHLANHVQRFEEGQAYPAMENQGVFILSEIFDPGFQDRFVEMSEEIVKEVCLVGKPKTCTFEGGSK